MFFRRWRLVTCSVLLPVVMTSCHQGKLRVEPKAELAEAWRDYRLGEFDQSLAKFQATARAAGPDAAVRLQALYGVATTWNLRRPGEDIQKATAFYEQIVEQGPSSDMAAWSLLALARIKDLVPVGQQPDLATARRAYLRVIEHFPSHPAGEEAFLFLQKTLLTPWNQAQTQAVVADMEQFVRAHEYSPYLSAAYSVLASGYEVLDQSENRLAASIQALERSEVDPLNSSPDHANSYWQIATLAEFKVGDFATARTYYQRFVEEYPTDARTFPARQALRRMDTLEKKLRDERALGQSASAGGKS